MGATCFKPSTTLVRGLDATWLRNEVISNNIANVDTPGFKVSEVEFEDVLVAAVSNSELGLKTTREGHIKTTADSISDVEPTVVTSWNTSYTADENNVDIESEMVDLAKNSLEYYTLVSKLNSEFRKLNTAISG